MIEQLVSLTGGFTIIATILWSGPPELLVVGCAALAVPALNAVAPDRSAPEGSSPRFQEDYEEAEIERARVELLDADDFHAALPAYEERVGQVLRGGNMPEGYLAAPRRFEGAT